MRFCGRLEQRSTSGGGDRVGAVQKNTKIPSKMLVFDGIFVLQSRFGSGMKKLAYAERPDLQGTGIGIVESGL